MANHSELQKVTDICIFMYVRNENLDVHNFDANVLAKCYHRITVRMKNLIIYVHFNSTFGSFHSASSAYQKWSTWGMHSMSAFHSSKRYVILIESIYIRRWIDKHNDNIAITKGKMRLRMNDSFLALSYDGLQFSASLLLKRERERENKSKNWKKLKQDGDRKKTVISKNVIRPFKQT
uniref:Uncharacterized protein n=1 Tax=Onchocerca volvulus TaxID=6282 RepID=A0A8R1TWC4_ONCVO